MQYTYHYMGTVYYLNGGSDYIPQSLDNITYQLYPEYRGTYSDACYGYSISRPVQNIVDCYALVVEGRGCIEMDVNFPPNPTQFGKLHTKSRRGIMGRLVKRLISIIVVVSVAMTFVTNGTAVDVVDPYAEIKAAIYQQLKAQNALHHYEIHVAEIVPDNSKVMLANAATQSWNAPNGGALKYKYDWTYRDEEGYVYTETSYLDENGTDKLLAEEFGTWAELVGFGIGVATAKHWISPLVSGLSLLGIIEDIAIRTSIDNAGGYARVSVVYDSISCTTSTVTIGWDTHPTIFLVRGDAYDIEFEYAN